MYTIGIDIGSMSANGVLLNEKKEILSSVIIPTGASSKKAGEKTYQQILTEHKLSEKDIDYIIATGYGRVKVPFAQERELTITSLRQERLLILADRTARLSRLTHMETCWTSL